jgi:hypothetical protein
MATKKLSDFPGVASQLDSDRNGGITADQITAGSHLKYWWRCDKGPDHFWQATSDKRTEKSTGCPACTGRQVSVTNGCGSSEGTSCGLRNGVVDVAGLVDASLFLVEVVAPVGLEVAVAA